MGFGVLLAIVHNAPVNEKQVARTFSFELVLLLGHFFERSELKNIVVFFS